MSGVLKEGQWVCSVKDVTLVSVTWKTLNPTHILLSNPGLCVINVLTVQNIVAAVESTIPVQQELLNGESVTRRHENVNNGNVPGTQDQGTFVEVRVYRCVHSRERFLWVREWG